MPALIKEIGIKDRKNRFAFTLIEMLVVVSIIGILVTISSFGLQGARESARDYRRKSDLESIRTALELYRADCGAYPPESPAGYLVSTIVGSGTPSRCALANTYITVTPQDPLTPSHDYRYFRGASGTTYELCARLEDEALTDVNCNGGPRSCGSSGNCNYRTTSQ